MLLHPAQSLLLTQTVLPTLPTVSIQTLLPTQSELPAFPLLPTQLVQLPMLTQTEQPVLLPHPNQLPMLACPNQPSCPNQFSSSSFRIAISDDTMLRHPVPLLCHATHRQLSCSSYAMWGQFIGHLTQALTVIFVVTLTHPPLQCIAVFIFISCK